MDDNGIRKEPWSEKICSSDENDMMRTRTCKERSRNFDTHTLICCNIPAYVDENYVNMRSIIDFILKIDNIELCIEKITNSNEYIFLIISDQYIERILPEVHHLYQLNSIFITGETTTTSDKWIQEYPKVSKNYYIIN